MGCPKKPTVDNNVPYWSAGIAYPEASVWPKMLPRPWISQPFANWWRRLEKHMAGGIKISGPPQLESNIWRGTNDYPTWPENCWNTAVFPARWVSLTVVGRPQDVTHDLVEAMVSSPDPPRIVPFALRGMRWDTWGKHLVVLHQRVCQDFHSDSNIISATSSWIMLSRGYLCLWKRNVWWLACVVSYIHTGWGPIVS